MVGIDPDNLPRLHELPPFAALYDISKKTGIDFTLYGGAAGRAAMYLWYQPKHGFDLFDLAPFTSDFDLAHSGNADQTKEIQLAIADLVPFSTWCRWSLIDNEKWIAARKSIAEGVQVPLRQLRFGTGDGIVWPAAAFEDLENRKVSLARQVGFSDTAYAREGRSLEIFGLFMALNTVADLQEIAGEGRLADPEAALHWLDSDDAAREAGLVHGTDGAGSGNVLLATRAWHLVASRKAHGKNDQVTRAADEWCKRARLLDCFAYDYAKAVSASAFSVTKLTASGSMRVPQLLPEVLTGESAKRAFDRWCAAMAEAVKIPTPSLDPAFQLVGFVEDLSVVPSPTGEKTSPEPEVDDFGSIPNGEFLHLSWLLPFGIIPSGLTALLLPGSGDIVDIARFAEFPTANAIGGVFAGGRCWLRIDVEAPSHPDGGRTSDYPISVAVFAPRAEAEAAEAWPSSGRLRKSHIADTGAMAATRASQS